MISIRKVKYRNRYIILSKIQRKLRYSSFIRSIIIIAILELNNNTIYIKILKWGLLFYRKWITVLETGYFSFILLAHPLEILSNYLGSSRYHTIVSFTELAYQTNIKSTRLILIIIFSIGVISTLYRIKIILVYIFMLFKKFLYLLGICVW
jgi:hypothetical protein